MSMHNLYPFLGALLAPIVAHHILAGSFERAGVHIKHTLGHLRSAATAVAFCMATLAGSNWRFVALTFFLLIVLDALLFDLRISRATKERRGEKW